MKRLLGIILSLTLIVPSFAVKVKADSATEAISYNYSYDFNNGYDKSENHIRQMEKLDRGLIAIRTNEGVYLSWRLLDSEDNIYGSANSNVSFNVYRDNTKITTVSKATCYTDTEAGTSYSVAPVINGQEGEKCTAVSVKDNSYFDIPLVKPDDETVEYVYPYNVINKDTGEITATYTNATYSFSPADCSTGDLDGDGEYEIIVKWTSSERDVGEPGNPAYSGTVRFAAYKLDGTKLWDNDINLGKNVYSSAHTVQFLVYDFDGDGKAEMMCQTSLGSKDAKGRYVSHSAKADSVIAAEGKSIAEFTDEENESADYRGYGRIIVGEEFLTVFNGETGEAIDTIDLPTTRGSANGVDYGDDFGNRSNRFVADVAYLDGVKPYAVYLRGYYFGKSPWNTQRTSIAGISFDGERLSPDYRFDTQEGQEGYYEGSYNYVGNGNHNCTVADVDNDGKDEFITGALCMEVKDDNSFKPRWCTFMEHGDALHIGDYDPLHKGFEFFTVHEDAGPNKFTGTEIGYGMSVIDADTGEIIKHWTASKDTGRGLMANVGAGGYYQVNAGNQVTAHIANGNGDFTDMRSRPFSNNFRIFWDGDLYDELLDGTNTYDNRGRFSAISVTSWNGKSISSIFNIPTDCVAINGTKANPALQADLFGDWREEVIYPVSSNDALRVFSTTTPTDYKIKTLMHDPVYRSGVAAEQTAYNQPPHVGFYMGEEVFKAKVISITAEVLNNTFILGESFDKSKIKVTADYSDGSQEEISNYAIAGFDSSQEGEQQVVITYLGQSASFTANVKGASISDINGNYTTASASLSRNKIPITNSEGYNGSFVIEHTFTLNSFPQNGTYDKKDEAGFFVRFQPNSGTGGGWSIRKTEDNKYEVFWKSASAMAIPSSTADTTVLNLGETYNFKYIFTKVATGEGALVQLIISDLQGNTISNKSALPLRNMTNDDQKVNPLKYIEITNQAAAEGTTASFSIENARLYGNSTINNITGNLVNITLNNFASTSSVFAAKYNTNNELIQITKFDYTQDGTFSWELPFEPDKVFIWEENMVPIDFKTK